MLFASSLAVFAATFGIQTALGGPGAPDNWKQRINFKAIPKLVDCVFGPLSTQYVVMDHDSIYNAIKAANLNNCEGRVCHVVTEWNFDPAHTGVQNPVELKFDLHFTDDPAQTTRFFDSMSNIKGTSQGKTVSCEATPER